MRSTAPTSLAAPSIASVRGRSSSTGTISSTRPGRRESTTTRLLLDGIDADPGARTADLAVVVHPLRPADPASGDMVTLGREPRHDVVILDASVSRFHAFARRAEGGQFQIQDAGSTNGTTVNGRSVLQRGAGPPTPLKPGDTLRLGQVEFTFTDAGGLRSFVTKAAR